MILAQRQRLKSWQTAIKVDIFHAIKTVFAQMIGAHLQGSSGKLLRLSLENSGGGSKAGFFFKKYVHSLLEPGSIKINYLR